ncbi:hypothetical protein A5762_14800 [Mycolicibacterium elephantis]|nr:hypothetical protein A5762_14800 [Mycolicibacterium elephantis]
MEHVRAVQFLDAFEKGKSEGTQLRVVGRGTRVDVLAYVTAGEELTEEVRVLAPVISSCQLAATEYWHHARRTDSLHSGDFAFESFGVITTRDDLAGLDHPVLNDPPAFAHAAGRAHTLRLLAWS